MTPEERTAYYRWEFRKWYQTPYPSLCCPGGLAIKTSRRAEWLCSGCGDDVSLAAVLMYKSNEKE